jgi:hypothetical protein
MEEYNVLVFPCGTEVANEIINSLRHNKYFKLKYASSEEKNYCNYRSKPVYFLPYVYEDNFLNELNDLVFNKKIDCIIPAHDDVAYELSILNEKINAKIIGQSKEINKIVRFKDKTYRYFNDLVPIPKFKISPLQKNNYPVFVKPKRGQGSQNAFMLESKRDYEIFLEKYKVEDFVIMEYLSGEEFTIDCFSDNGEILYCGARTREKTISGISVRSTLVNERELNKKFLEYAKIISSSLNFHGVWFFQMKYNENEKLKLLEIGPRISGTMMLNRARGINFVELALYQKLGFDVEVFYNDINISLAKSLVPIYDHDLTFQNLYVDFDDTLYLENNHINPDIMKLIFQAKNNNKNIIIITKHKKNDLFRILNKFGLREVFDEIIWIDKDDKKTNHIQENSLLIDDSFQERKEAINNDVYAIGIDNINLLFKDGIS